MPGEIEVGRAAVRLILDDSSFWRDVARLSSATVDDIKIKAEADTAAATAQVKKLKAETATADDTIKVDVDRRGLAGIGMLTDNIREMGGVIRGLGSIVSLAKLPLLIASIGGLVPIAAAATVRVGQLALGLGQALVGAAGVGAVAIGGLAAGLSGYVGIVSQAVSASREAYLAITEETQKRLEQERQLILNTRASYDFNIALDEMITQFTRLQAQVGRRVFPTFERWIGLLDQRLPLLTPILFRLVDGVTEVADSFVRAVVTGERFGDLRRTLGFVASSGIRAAQMAKQLGLALLAAIQPILPLSASLQRTMVDLSRSTRRWAESVRGQRQIAEFFRSAWARARQLYGIVVNLGRGFRNLFSAIGGGGGVDRAMRGLANMARQFAHVTREGGKAFQMIRTFSRQSEPVLRALWRLTKTLGREFLILARNVMGMRQGSSAARTLVRAINGLTGAVRPLRKLFEETFEGLGPMIGPLVRQVAQLGRTFAGNTGVLQRFLRTLVSLMRTFNRLPEPVKNLVAELIAFRIICKLLGVNVLITLVASLGKAALGMRRYSTATKGATASSTAFHAANTKAKWVGFGAIVGVAIVGIIKNFQHFKNVFIPQYGKALKETMKAPFSKAAIEARAALLDGLFKAPFMPFFLKWFQPGKTFLNKQPGEFKTIGSNIIQGLINGILTKIPGVGNALQALATRMPDWVKKALGISSPSKVFAGLGQEVARGFAEGILRNAHLAENATRQMALRAHRGAVVSLPSGASRVSGGSVVNHFGGLYAPTSLTVNRGSDLEAYRSELKRMVDEHVDGLRRSSTSYTSSMGGVK